MKKILSVLAIVLALACLLSACGSEDVIGGGSSSTTSRVNSQATTHAPAGKAEKTKTVMIYLVGSDLESKQGSASDDIIEMLNSGVDTNNTKVLIYTGGTKKWSISEIPVNKNCIYELDGGDFNLVKEYDSLNMGKSSTLAEFIKYGFNNYKTDEYGLILWDHGGGPMVGYGVDELHNDILEMSELKSALSSAGLGGNKKLEFLGFDACLMGSVEVAWEIKDYANYFIASQETEPGWGWDYGFLKQLDYYDGGENIGRCIIDSYFNTSEDIFRRYPHLKAELTLSCLDLSKINKVENGLNALFEKVDSNILDGYFAKASRVRHNVKSFGKYSSGYSYDLIDMSHLVSLLASDYASESNQLKADLNEFITYSRSNITNASGVSIYHPYDNTAEMSSWINQFKKLGFATKYANYISDFSNMLLNPSSPSWKTFSSTKGTAIKNGSNNELSIQLTDEQAQNYAGSAYYILKKHSDDEYMFIFAGFDSTLDSNGVLSATYNNKAVFAVSDKNGSVSDSPIMMYQVRDGSGEQKYCASAMFWLFADDITDWKTDPVEWQIKIENGVPQALGAYLIDGENDEKIPQKQLLNYQDYSYVEFANFTKTPKKDADGNILPYFEWESTGNFYGNGYDVADGFHLECREIDNKEDYYVMFVVYDSQGNSYASEMFTLPN